MLKNSVLQSSAVSQDGPSQSVAVPAASVGAVCTAAFLIGAALVFMVGFANASVLHDAAHDSRHSLAFPCH